MRRILLHVNHLTRCVLGQLDTFVTEQDDQDEWRDSARVLGATIRGS